MPNAKYLEPKKGMTSLQAAAMYLSDGATDDAQEVNQTVQAETFNMDALQRAHLSKLMGFRFSVDVTYKKITVKSNEPPYFSKSAAFSGVMDQEAVDTVVELCGQLKELWDSEKQKENINV